VQVIRSIGAALLVSACCLAAKCGSAGDSRAAAAGGASASTSACARQRTRPAQVACLANAFTATLTPAQRSALQLPLSAENARHWSSAACASGCRNGLPLRALNGTQTDAALAVARAALSAEGYSAFDETRQADDQLAKENGAKSHAAFGAGNYYIAILGTPSPDGAWMLQLGGHDYAVNVAYDGAILGGATPSFVGVPLQPPVTFGGATYLLKSARRDAIYTMIQALPKAVRKTAEITGTFDDVAMGPGRDGTFPPPQGLLVSTLDPDIQALVKAAIEAWVNDVPSDLAKTLLPAYESAAALAQTRIGWAKADNASVAGSYLRIDGPRVWIELVRKKDPNGGQDRFETVWRDKAKDYGGRFGL
jgi:hypothetical protein